MTPADFPARKGGDPLHDGRPAGVDADRFRRALATFASGITVITTSAGDAVYGMTASAFMSGSLAPPLVVVSVGRRARLHDLVLASGVFGVSILSWAQEAVSRHFSGQRRDFEDPGFDWQCGVPVLRAAMTGLAASLEHAHDCGDHTLFVGRVLWAEAGEDAPLLHFRGGYRHLAPPAGQS